MYSPNKQVGAIDPVTGLPAQQMTNVPPTAANTPPRHPRRSRDLP